MTCQTVQRWGMYAAASVLLVVHAPLGAQKCKTFGSLVVRCALNAGCLSVANNVTIGGNLTVSGTVSTTTATLGDLLAFGTWVNTAPAGGVNAATNLPFPTVVGTPSNISINGANSIFTIDLAGTYLIMYQVSGATAGNTFLQLQHTPFGGSIGAVTGGTVDFPTNGDTNFEASNAVIVPGVGVGDTFNLLNGPDAIAFFNNVGAVTANGASITFIRIHA
jgi:hypothetical protein